MSILRRVSFFRFAVVALVVASGFVPAGSSVLAAQAGPSNQDVAFSVEGKITDVSPGKFTVDSGGGMNFNVVYNSKTMIEHSDKTPAKPDALHEGVKVRAEGTLTESGDVVAKRIVIEPEK